MCGIAGLIGHNWTSDNFDKLFEAIQHRGPDRRGVFRTNHLQLGMNRLRCRGPDTFLPVHLDDVIAAFNGQIYGIHEPDGYFLKFPVGIQHEISSVIPEYGNVDGMYACALCTGDGASVILKTDPQFIKPLFIRQTDKGYAFCSEFAPLLRLSDSNKIHWDALSELFTYGWYLTDQSYVTNLQLVWKHNIIMSSKEVRETEKSRGFATHGLENDNVLRNAIRTSVLRCIDGIGPFGLAISGGLDSTILAWELNEAGFEDLTTLSVRSLDEDDGINSLADLGLPKGGVWEKWKHRIVTIDSDRDFFSAFETATKSFGQPSTMSSLPLYQRLAEIAAEEGIRVLLTGEGVDELFCGYESYSKVQELTSLTDYYLSPKRDNLVRILFGEKVIANTRDRFSSLYSEYRDLRLIEREMRLVRLLLRTDVCLMSMSIEGRVPYLHNQIPEIALSIPWQELVHAPGKTVLRRAYRDKLGKRASTRKTRFKASDSVLRRCLDRRDIFERVHYTTTQVFGKTESHRCLSLLKSDEGFDADICCLLMTPTFIVEDGILDDYTK